MKKVYSTILMLSMIIGVLNLCACGGNDDNSNSNDELHSAYKKLQTSIVGTWIMESYYDENRYGNPYVKYGWNDSWPYNKAQQYKYVFNSDGKVIDNSSKTYSYSLYMDENIIPDYIDTKNKGCWPYSKGVIYLKIESEYSPFYAEIKNDGMLYLYNTVPTTGGDGVPKYRYKRQ